MSLPTLSALSALSPLSARRTLVTLASLAALSLAPTARAQTAPASASREADLALRLERLATELEAVKAQLLELKKAQVAASVPAPLDLASGTAQANGLDASRPEGPATVLSSYGELNLNRYRRQPSQDSADLRRFVLGFQHRLDPKTKVVAELEVEHAVASSSDAGEVALEQAFAERQLTPELALRAGLFLMPAGLLNENHEPTAYYGVERNFVETAIIPSTWREGGLQLVSTFDNGLTVQGGVSTGFDINKWDASSSESVESPLGAIHQEMALAKSHDLAVFGAVNWRGVPGLQLGGSLFSGKASQSATATGSMSVTLWDLHARYTPGNWDLSALYARGHIGHTAAFNQAIVGSDHLVPQRFDGGYLQVANKVWSQADLSLAPFVRWERLNTRAAYADIGQGLTPAAAPYETVWTMGANFNVGSGLVFKADVQRFAQNRDANRLDLGMGWSF